MTGAGQVLLLAGREQTSRLTAHIGDTPVTAVADPYDALLVPDTAIVTDQSRKLVMTVKDGTVAPKVVRLGPMQNGLRVVRGGVDPDDQVIINGLMRARPGAKVTPQPGKIE